MIWQLGYPDPPWQPLHQQRVPSAYQHARVESGQVVAAVGGGDGHAAGSGGLLQAAGGAVTDHVPSDWQSAVVRHDGRKSSPHEQ